MEGALFGAGTAAPHAGALDFTTRSPGSMPPHKPPRKCKVAAQPSRGAASPGPAAEVLALVADLEQQGVGRVWGAWGGVLGPRGAGRGAGASCPFHGAAGARPALAQCPSHPPTAPSSVNARMEALLEAGNAASANITRKAKAALLALPKAVRERERRGGGVGGGGRGGGRASWQGERGRPRGRRPRPPPSLSPQVRSMSLAAYAAAHGVDLVTGEPAVGGGGAAPGGRKRAPSGAAADARPAKRVGFAPGSSASPPPARAAGAAAARTVARPRARAARAPSSPPPITATVLRRGGAKSRTGVADGLAVALANGDTVTLNVETGLSGLDDATRAAVSAQLEALQRLASTLLGGAGRRRRR